MLDTHLLIWAADDIKRVPPKARELMSDEKNELLFSVVSIWEVAIKRALNRVDFQLDPRKLRRGLVDNGYIELPILGEHAAAISGLPLIHKDPFDRMLIAQSVVEGISLVTNDETVALYPGVISA